MARQNTVQREQLEDAFQVFNQVSSQLVDSYHQLQAQVACLTSELSEARSERLQQMAEKVSLANRLTRLLETLPAAVIVLDGKGVVSQVNPAAIELLPGIALGCSWKTIYQRHFKSEQQSAEQWLISGRLVTLTQRSLEPESGRIILLLDVTETRQLQERMARRQRLSVMGEMSAQLAHQIRTPLSAALIDTTHLSRTDLTQVQRERFSQRCLERLRHIESQINDMLAFAKGGQFELAPISIKALMKELQQGLEALCVEHNAVIELRFDQITDGSVIGNQAALLGAMMNVAVNALQQPGAIHLIISLHHQMDSVLIEFTDDGPGIADEHIKHILDPFYTTRPDGTGLGLAVVQSVVLAHHGKLTVDSVEAGGARFSISLPISEEVSALSDTLVTNEYESAVRSSA
ncbi:MAG: ATP-binding protein [Sedimenticola sp.]|nr:ATP-binding protein [Sedimenticola sp.]